MISVSPQIAAILYFDQIYVRPSNDAIVWRIAMHSPVGVDPINANWLFFNPQNIKIKTAKRHEIPFESAFMAYRSHAGNKWLTPGYVRAMAQRDDANRHSSFLDRELKVLYRIAVNSTLVYK